VATLGSWGDAHDFGILQIRMPYFGVAEPEFVTPLSLAVQNTRLPFSTQLHPSNPPKISMRDLSDIF
jgi:hypothetical protein